MEIGTADYAPDPRDVARASLPRGGNLDNLSQYRPTEPCGNAGRLPMPRVCSCKYDPDQCTAHRTCAMPGDQEHDHQMCEDVNAERAIEEALAFAPPGARVAARAAIDSMIREARLSGLTAATDPAEGEPWHPYEQSDPAVNGCDHCGQDRRLHP